MIYKSTEDSHVKMNLVYTLFSVYKYRLLLLEKFIEILRSLERKQCSVQSGQKHWYLMSIEVFIALIFLVINTLQFI